MSVAVGGQTAPVSDSCDSKERKKEMKTAVKLWWWWACDDINKLFILPRNPKFRKAEMWKINLKGRINQRDPVMAAAAADVQRVSIFQKIESFFDLDDLAVREREWRDRWMNFGFYRTGNSDDWFGHAQAHVQAHGNLPREIRAKTNKKQTKKRQPQ